MKPPWLVFYWDDDADKEVKVGVRSYEDAMRLCERVRRKFNRSCHVVLRSEMRK